MDLVCIIPRSRDLHRTDNISISWRREVYTSVSETLLVISFISCPIRSPTNRGLIDPFWSRKFLPNTSSMSASGLRFFTSISRAKQQLSHQPPFSLYCLSSCVAAKQRFLSHSRRFTNHPAGMILRRLLQSSSVSLKKLP